MTNGFPSEFGADPIPQGGEFRALKIDGPTTPKTDHHILRLLPVDELEMRLLRIKEGLGDDSRFLKKSKRSIDRRLGNPMVRHPMAMVTHVEQQLLRFEWPVVIDDRLQNVRSFLGVLQSLTPKEPPKDRAKGHQDLGRCFGHRLSIKETGLRSRSHPAGDVPITGPIPWPAGLLTPRVIHCGVAEAVSPSMPT